MSPKFPGIDVSIKDSAKRARSIQRCRERNIIIPTFAQQKDPKKIPTAITKKLKGLGLWDLESLNLFRITWKNDVGSGLYGNVNFLEIPSSITGIDARVIGIVGRYFPTGAHKVGATFGCLVPRLVTGEFDPTTQKAVWPSTGNFCRGGAYDAHLLACDSVAILPQEMSKERFDWLKKIGAEIFATPGCESNVKEIFDKCWELRKERGDKIVIFNQFEEFGNSMWHYEVTGSAIEEVFRQVAGSRDRLAGYCSSTGSGGTIAAGDYLKKVHPMMKVAASEALQCPTLLSNGFGGHRIEGIGDKHVPFVHNVKNTDAVVAIDDEDCMRLMRLFNEPVGRDWLKRKGAPADVVDKLDLLGISGIGNLLTAVKMAKYYELTSKDVIFTVFTDSMELYGSRMEEARKAHGEYTETQAAVDWHRRMDGQHTGDMLDCTYADRKRIHNLKYYTWVEQQARDVEELNAQWYDEDYWDERLTIAPKYDRLIEEFNREVGLLEKLG